MKHLAVALLGLSLTACSTDWGRGIYEANRQYRPVRDDPATVSPTPDLHPQTLPAYKDYKREVDELKGVTPAPSSTTSQP